MSAVAKLHRKEQLRYATYLNCAQIFRAIKIYLMYLDARPITGGVQGGISPLEKVSPPWKNVLYTVKNF